jgi:diguanylate cyclase (GGDEF)-like protein
MAKVRELEQMLKKSGKLLTINENETAKEAAKKMTDNGVGCLLVLNPQNKFAGILSERDVLAKVTTNSLSPDSVLVRNIMTTNVISCSKDTDVNETQKLMSKHKIRHIPIIEDDVPVGMISNRDIINYQLSTSNAMRTAAEQLAIFATKLKGNDFDEIIRNVMDEAPKSFEAKSAVICFTQKDNSEPIIYRKGCPVPGQYLAKPNEIMELFQNGWAICGTICNRCEKTGGQAPRVIIPLHICEQYDDGSDNQTHTEGFLCMCQLNPASYNSEDQQSYKAALLQEILNVNLTNAKLYNNYQKARRDSEIDTLTNVGTRRLLNKMLKIEHARALRYKSCFSLALIDVDKLKQINDTNGHAAGDAALREIGKTISQAIRNVDLITRYGGDEFVLLMPETRLSGAKILINRLQERIRKISVPNVKSISVSCGLAEWDGSTNDTIEKIFARVDAALYEAKHNGRDCLVTSEHMVNVA